VETPYQNNNKTATSEQEDFKPSFLKQHEIFTLG